MRESDGLGGRIRMVRGALTQKQFARALNVSQGSVAKYESGKSIPGAATLVRIAKLGGIAPEDLLDGDEEKPPARADRAYSARAGNEKKLLAAAREIGRGYPRLLGLLAQLLEAMAQNLKKRPARRRGRGRR